MSTDTPPDVQRRLSERHRSFTVAFAAYNAAGHESLLRLGSIHIPCMNINILLLPDRADGYQQPPLRQIYYWTTTVGE